MFPKYIALCLMAAVTWQNDIAYGQKIVVGYYPSWSQTTYTHSDIQYQNLTHIAHAFIASKTDGSLEIPTGFLYPSLNQTAHRNGVSVVVSVGGWGDYSTRFSPMVADTAARHRFVANVTNFCIANDYDGVDFDWEYPNTAADRTNLQLLVHELRVAFKSTYLPMFIGMAMPSSGWGGQWYDIAGMNADMDWYGIMTYDYYGSWTTTSGPNSALYGNLSINSEGWVDYSVDYYKTTRGVPTQKLLIGLPFYGWMFNASSMYGSSTGASQLAYQSIAPKLDQGWIRHWDNDGAVPYIVNPTSTQLISYDDSASITQKCNYVNTKPVGGTIIWAIGQDKMNGRQPLLDIVGSKLVGTTGIPRIAPTTAPLSFQLSQNFPNPFNGQTHIKYSVPADFRVVIKLYDMLGREVKTLADRFHTSGEYQVTVSSNELVSGVYVYRMQTPAQSIAKMFVVIR